MAWGKGGALVKVSTAVFYGASSIFVMFVNKILLTNYQFPSFLFLAIVQMAATIVILLILHLLRIITLPKLDKSVPRRIFPLPILFLLSIVSGLGGTQKLSLPMFTVLRRFSIFLTLLLEYYILRVEPTLGVCISISLMMLGAVVAAMYDLSFDSYGYLLVFTNNFASAANGVFLKKKLVTKDLGKYGFLVFNSLFALPPAIGLLLLSNDVEKVKEFAVSDNMNAPVLSLIGLSCITGLLLNYSLALCLQVNSALTTTCIGPIKNLVVTYVGMVSSGDYVFQWANFIGVNISVLGSMLYTYVTFRRPTQGKIEAKRKSRTKRSISDSQITVEPIEKSPLVV